MKWTSTKTAWADSISYLDQCCHIHYGIVQIYKLATLKDLFVTNCTYIYNFITQKALSIIHVYATQNTLNARMSREQFPDAYIPSYDE